MSETITDIAQEILEDPSWDPSTIHSPLCHLIPEPETESSSPKTIESPLPLAIALIPKLIQIDVYIDDIVTTTIHEHQNIKRAREAVPLAIHTVFRPVAEEEPIHRDWPVSVRKLLGDGKLEHKKTNLGWTIDAHSFRIHLEQKKYEAWLTEIDEVLDKGTVTGKQMECLIGKLNHVGFIIPSGRYFLPRLRYRQKMTEKYGRTSLHQWDINDLILWQIFLKHTTEIGTRIDHFSFSLSSSFCISDASKHGMGGFTSEGVAWRWELPHDLREKASINLLEFIAATVTIEFSLQFLDIENSARGIKILSLTDSSSALGWLYHSTFKPGGASTP